MVQAGDRGHDGCLVDDRNDHVSPTRPRFLGCRCATICYADTLQEPSRAGLGGAFLRVGFNSPRCDESLFDQDIPFEPFPCGPTGGEVDRAQPVT